MLWLRTDLDIWQKCKHTKQHFLHMWWERLDHYSLWVGQSWWIKISKCTATHVALVPHQYMGDALAIDAHASSHTGLTHHGFFFILLLPKETWGVLYSGSTNEAQEANIPLTTQWEGGRRYGYEASCEDDCWPRVDIYNVPGSLSSVSIWNL